MMTATRGFDLDIRNAWETNSFSYRILAFKRPKSAEESERYSALSLENDRSVRYPQRTPGDLEIAIPC